MPGQSSSALGVLVKPKMIDWLKKVSIGLITGLLVSYLLFYGTLQRLEGKVDAMEKQIDFIYKVAGGQEDLPEGPRR